MPAPVPEVVPEAVPEFVVVTGMSGAGRSTSANALEDAGWFVIDNLPPALIPGVTDLVAQSSSQLRRVALVASGHEYRDDLVAALQQLRQRQVRLRVLYLDAPSDVLVRRYEDTRRRHPLHASSGAPASQGSGTGGPATGGQVTGGPATGGSVIEAIETERELLAPVRDMADIVIDTAELNVHDLRARMSDEFADPADRSGMRTTVMSFGYKHGIPRNADLVFDCRFLPNPHWVPELRDFTGLQPPVRSWVLEQPAAKDFLDGLVPLLARLLPDYQSEGRSYLTVAFGCTGGRHRSVALSEEVASRLAQLGHDSTCRHRDIGS